jgi:hypothetical protein
MKFGNCQFVNYTPHIINIHTDDGILSVPASADGVPRLKVEREELGVMHGITFWYSKMGDPEGLPEPEYVDKMNQYLEEKKIRPNIYFIVSALVAEHPATRNRTGLVYPGEAIRNESGQIIGYRLHIERHLITSKRIVVLQVT